MACVICIRFSPAPPRFDAPSTTPRTMRCHPASLSSRHRAENPAQARCSKILHEGRQCAGLPIARFLVCRSEQIIDLNRLIPKSPRFSTLFWPLDFFPLLQTFTILLSPHQCTFYSTGEFFQSNQTNVAGGRTKTRLLVENDWA
jgi:hypothetical protein